MNERIKELYQQAYDSVHEFQAGMLVLDPVEEKFAELIIQDCYQKLVDMDQQVKASHNYYKHAAIQIRLHFGIEP